MPSFLQPSAQDLGMLLSAAIQDEASDLHLVAGRPARLRKDGRLMPPQALCAPAALAESIFDLGCGDNLAQRAAWEVRFSQTKLLDVGVDFLGRRFRCHLYQAQGRVHASLRLIPNQCRELKSLGLPEAYHRLIESQHGLIVVCGATGAGKTTTLNSTIDHFNRTSPLVIQTFEDPVEFLHKDNQCIIAQCSIGETGDVANWADAGRAVLRRDPDVIVFGELRDLATLESAMRAAGSGHLVFGTLHSSSATAAVEQMLQSFPETDKEFFRTLLVQSMLGVVSQVLVPAQAGGRVAVYELLRNTLAVANQISAGKPNMLRGEMQTGFVQGTMQTRDQHLLQLFKNRTITEASALEWALDRSEIASQIRRIISR